MRVAYIGVSHWHTRLYVNPVLEMKDMTVVGMSDRNEQAARDYAQRVGCSSFRDYRDMCERTKPDFVFALGRHCDMAEVARFLIDTRIPFAMEKPCGGNVAEVADLAERVSAARAFAAVPFVFRQSDLLKIVRERAAGEDTQYLTFKFVSGQTSRYQQMGCDYMLDRKQAGGGCTLNLSVHFLDLLRVFMGAKPIQVKAAVMSNAAWNLDIEDYSAIILQCDARTCLIETGYIYPAVHGAFDMRFCIRTDRHYFITLGPDALEVSDESAQREIVNVGTTMVPYYRTFVIDALARAAHGQAPIAGMADMAEVMRLADAAYRIAGRGGAG